MSERAEECSVVQLGRLDYRDANALQERVRDAREACRLTNLELARQLGVTERTVIRWQAGKVPPYSRLAGLAHALLKQPSHFLEVLA